MLMPLHDSAGGYLVHFLVLILGRLFTAQAVFSAGRGNVGVEAQLVKEPALTVFLAVLQIEVKGRLV